MYNYVISFWNLGKKPENPFTKEELTQDDIKKIMNGVKYALQDPNIENIDSTLHFDRKLSIFFILKDNFYEVYIVKRFGHDSSGLNFPIYKVCVFPAYIDVDRELHGQGLENSSAGMKYIFEVLFEDRKLLHNYNSPYGIYVGESRELSMISLKSEILKFKSIDDWMIIKDKAGKKRQRTENEILQLFQSFYSELNRFL
jgi:hypothetical protein